MKLEIVTSELSPSSQEIVLRLSKREAKMLMNIIGNVVGRGKIEKSDMRKLIRMAGQIWDYVLQNVV